MSELRWRLGLLAGAGALAGTGAGFLLEELLPGEGWVSPLPLVALVALGAAAAAYLGGHGVGAALRAVAGRLEGLAAGEVPDGLLYLAGPDEVEELVRACNDLARAQRRQRREVAGERERFRAAMEHMEAGVLLLDARGRLLLSNPAARRLLGLTPGDHGRGHVEALRNYQLSEAVEQVLRHGGSLRRELTLIGAGERAVEAGLAATPAGVVAVLHDVTARRRQERLRNEFLANVSHELRTPVTAIRGFAETLLEDAETLPPQVRTYVGFIDREARRLARLVEDLLELVKWEERQVSLARREVDLAELAAEVVARFRPEAERRGLVLEAAGRRPAFAFVDGERVEQVLVNLLDNALKFTPAGGRVTVGAEPAEGGREVVLSVADTGPGIPAEELPLIFERFHRAGRQAGTGLGLAIVRQIVAAHGGRVWAESTPGAGSTFYVALPRWAPPAPAVGEGEDGGGRA